MAFSTALSCNYAQIRKYIRVVDLLADLCAAGRGAEPIGTSYDLSAGASPLDRAAPNLAKSPLSSLSISCTPVS